MQAFHLCLSSIRLTSRSLGVRSAHSSNPIAAPLDPGNTERGSTNVCNARKRTLTKGQDWAAISTYQVNDVLELSLWRKGAIT